ncbi:MAG TPA: SDR family oxidoreductase [Candidatus Onthocola stercoravium]|nr:SDR family oxidoreductase [Candidatus Onthocola stercoravium]
MLNDKVAVITGATRGIGFATAKLFLENGAKVAILGSKEESVNKALEKLPEYQDKTIGLYPNLNNEEEVRNMFQTVEEKFGKIDILINNAGISSSTPLENYTYEEFTKIVDLNLNALFLCSKVASEYMKKIGGGVILNTSSMVSIYGQPAGCGYPASKFAVNGLTKSLARELGRFNIRVNAVAPGVINTDMVAVLPKEVIAPIIQGIPLGRIGEPEDIANAFLYLASPMASFVTGAILSVDGAGRA